MRWSTASLVALTVVLVATACGAPETPEAWTVERQAEEGPADDVTTVCLDVEAAALGGLADHTDLEPVVEELSRLAALLGAADALPAFERIRTATPVTADDATTSGVDVGVELTVAGRTLDDASWSTCGVPVFTAIYASTSFADCHGELGLEANAYIATPDPAVPACGADDAPAFLPCWRATEGGYLPIDCRDRTIVAVRDGAWTHAGPPRATTTTTTTTTLPAVPTTTEAPPVVPRPDAPGCAAVVRLFVGSAPLRGDESDGNRLLAATRDLDPTVVALVDTFRQATVDAAPLEQVEAIVVDLDTATIDACGVPVISASVALVGGVEALPCWRPTGGAYPAWAPTSCTDG